MSHKRKRTFRRWSFRILGMFLMLPILVLLVIRLSGWLTMRDSDREIKATIAAHPVLYQMDSFRIDNRHIEFLKTTAVEAPNKSNAFLFVHGSPGSLDAYTSYMYDSTLLQFGDLIVYDRPGFGHSDFGVSLPSLEGQARVLKALMDSLGYDQYILTGHSYGAPIIAHAAIKYPSRIAGICLVAGSVDPAKEPKASWRKWLDLPLVRELLPVSMRVSNEELMPLRQDLEFIEDDWNDIRIPVSLIHGTKDALVPFENLAFASAQLTRSDTVLIKTMPEQSHFILWTHKEEVVEELTSLATQCRFRREKNNRAERKTGPN